MEKLLKRTITEAVSVDVCEPTMELGVTLHRVVSMVIQFHPAGYKPATHTDHRGSPVAIGSNICTSVRVSQVCSFTCALCSRSSERPGRRSSAAVCPNRGRSSLRGRTGFDRKSWPIPWRGEGVMSPDQNRQPGRTRPGNTTDLTLLVCSPLCGSCYFLHFT